MRNAQLDLSNFDNILSFLCAVNSTGSHDSTFSFRIREDRQMMGFSQESTFNNLCGLRESSDENDPHSCEKPTYWKIDETVRNELAESNQQQDESYHGEL